MMKKFFKRLAAVAACTVTALTAVACGGVRTETDDSTKTVLRVKYYNGGVGRVWIDDAIKQFEADFANVSFEKGKLGVEVKPEADKQTYAYSKIKNDANNVYIGVNYNYYQFASNGVMLDITDVVKGNALLNSTETESKTIESKITQDRQNFYNLDGTYYALPFFESAVNLVYNVDVFESKNYYFAKGRTAEGMVEEDLNNYEKIADLFISESGDEKSYGPDGKTGVIDGVDYSLDDGLPATYADFQALLTLMRNDNTIPFVWSGDTISYLTCFANEVWANSEGKTQYDYNFTLKGDAENLLDLNADGSVKFNADGTVKKLGETVKVTPETGYLLHSQKGLYDSLRFVEIMMSNKNNYYKDSFSGTFKYTDAQDFFINAKDKTETGNNDIAFIVEGSWWNNEARPKYKSETDRTSKRFAILPLPKPTAADIGRNNTKISERESLMFINAACPAEKIPVAKKFLSYIQSDARLNAFTKQTDMLRAMEYEVTQDTIDGMTYFGRNNYAISRAKNTDWTDWVPKSAETKKNIALYDYLVYSFNYGTASSPFSYFEANENATASELFAKIYNNSKDTWTVTTVK